MQSSGGRMRGRVALMGLILTGALSSCGSTTGGSLTRDGTPEPSWVLAGPSEGLPDDCGPGNFVVDGGTYWQCAWVDGEYRWAYDPAQPAPAGGGPALGSAANGNEQTETAMEGASKESCIKAWRDKEFAREIPQMSTSQDAALTDSIWEHCHRGWSLYMTEADRQRAYEGISAEVGQIAADAISARSRDKGMSICDAVTDVLKPMYDPGFGLIGWNERGLFPILYKQWQGGPMIAKLGGGCIDGKVLLQYRRHYDGTHEGPYYPPQGTAAANWILTEEQRELSWVNAGVCVVWSKRLGNFKVGGHAVVLGYTTVYNTDPINHVKANYEVITCELNAEIAAGLPVIWKPSASLDEGRKVTKEYAGVWHTMEDGCAWRLTPSGGDNPTEWTPSDGAYMVVELRDGDTFASTCQFQANSFEHMQAAPDGLFPVESLSPGLLAPVTPESCRYAMVGAGAMRKPPGIGELKAYEGSPKDLFSLRGANGDPSLLRSVGCGHWERLDGGG